MGNDEIEPLEILLTQFLKAIENNSNQLNRIEKILMGAQSPQQSPQLVGSDLIFENILKDFDELKKDVAILKRLFLSPEE